MTDAPKVIALRWQPGAAVTNGPLMDHPDYTRYVRQDMTHPIEAAADAVERELADLRAKLAVAVEALDYLVRAFDRVVGNSNHFYENIHRRDIHLDVNEGATIKCVADCRAALEEIKSGPRTKLALIEADNASLIAIANASRQHNADLRNKLDKAEEYSLELMHMIRDTADMNIQLRLKLTAVVEALEWQADQSEAHPFMAEHARTALAQIKGTNDG